MKKRMISLAAVLIIILGLAPAAPPATAAAPEQWRDAYAEVLRKAMWGYNRATRDFMYNDIDAVFALYEMDNSGIPLLFIDFYDFGRHGAHYAFKYENGIANEVNEAEFLTTGASYALIPRDPTLSGYFNDFYQRHTYPRFSSLSYFYFEDGSLREEIVLFTEHWSWEGEETTEIYNEDLHNAYLDTINASNQTYISGHSLTEASIRNVIYSYISPNATPAPATSIAELFAKI